MDNIFVYEPLPFVKNIYYMDVDLYRYFIGRADQSVNESVMIGRVDDLVKLVYLPGQPVERHRQLSSPGGGQVGGRGDGKVAHPAIQPWSAAYLWRPRGTLSGYSASCWRRCSCGGRRSAIRMRCPRGVTAWTGPESRTAPANAQRPPGKEASAARRRLIELVNLPGQAVQGHRQLVDLYRYFIGRADQSVNESVMMGRVDQQLRVNYHMRSMGLPSRVNWRSLSSTWCRASTSTQSSESTTL